MNLNQQGVSQRAEMKSMQTSVVNIIQGRIYIGASGSMAPGPEVLGGPFEVKKILGKLISLNMSGPQAQTESMSIRAMHWGPPL